MLKTGVGHACEETLDGSGKAVQRYLDSPAFLLDKQCQTRRELPQQSKLVSQRWLTGLRLVSAVNCVSSLTVPSTTSVVLHFSKVLKRKHVQALK